jgi:hypothetical protein
VDKWEYKYVRLDNSPPKVESELNALGAQGWEAVGMKIVGNADVYVLLKRRLL